MNDNVFVGREDELHTMRKIFSEAQTGLGKVLFVSGEPGSGKSALIREFIRRVEADDAVLSAVCECTDKEGLNSFGAFKEILLELNADAYTNDSGESKKLRNRLKGFIAESGPKWVGMIPIIGGIAAAGIETFQSAQKHFGKEAASETTSEREIYEIIESELRRLANKAPLIVFLDDLQWCDNASLNLLFSLCMNIRRNPFPLMLIGNYRPHDIAVGRNKISDTGENITIRHPLADKLNELRNYTKKESHIKREDQWLFELSVPPLSDTNIDSLLNLKFTDNIFSDGFKDKLKLVTEGHALFVNEILDSLVAKGHILQIDGCWQLNESELAELPVSVNSVIAERVDRLGAELRKVLDYAGVYGEDFSLQIVERILKIDELDLLDYIQELSQKHGLVVSSAERQLKDMLLDLYKFTHALVRKYIYENQEPARRRALHRRIADTMLDVYGEELETDPQAKQLYEQHKRIGKGVIDGITYKFSKETVRIDKQSSVLDFALEELSAAEKAYEEFALDECNLRIDRSLAFVSQLTDSSLEVESARYDALFLRAKLKQRSGLYKDALAACDALLALPTTELNAVCKANVLKQKAKALHFLARYDDAIDLYDQALAVYTALDNKDLVADCFNDKGVSYNALADYDSAMDSFNSALTINRKLNLIDKVAENLTNLGSTYRYMGDYNSARPYYDQALPLALALNKMPLISQIYNNIGLVVNSNGYFVEAISFFDKALAIDKELNDKPNMANHTNNIGLAYEYMGMFDKAIEYYSACLAIDESLDDVVKMALSYNNIGNVYAAKANFERAYEYFSRALEINKANNDFMALSSSYTNLGNMYYRKNELDKAKEYLEKSLEINLTLKDDAAAATDYNNLGNVLHSLGNYDAALEYYQKTLDVHQKLGNKLMFSTCYNNIGTVMYAKNDVRKAIEYYKKSFEVSEEVNDLFSAARTYSNIAACYEEVPADENVRFYYEKSIEIYRSMNSEVDLSNQLYKYGKYLYEINDYDKALDLFNETIPILEKLNLQNDNLFNARLFLAYILELRGESDKVIENLLHLYDLSIETETYEKAANVASDLADFFERKGQMTDGLVWRKKAYEYYIDIESYSQAADVFIRTADAYKNSGEFESSIQIHNKYAIPNYERAQDDAGIGSSKNKIANCYLNLSDYKKAEKYYKEALSIFTNLDDAFWMGALNFNLGLTENMRDNNKMALTYFVESQKRYEQADSPTDAAECVFYQAQMQSLLGNDQKQKELADKALKLYRANSMDVGPIYEFLGVDYNEPENTGQPDCLNESDAQPKSVDEF